MSSATNNQPKTHDDGKRKNATTLDEMVAATCFCKLREVCPDKMSPQCKRHRNIYQEFMFARKERSLA